MSPCPSCGAIRGAHRQEHFCDDCDQEGCVRCMTNGLCRACREDRKRDFGRGEVNRVFHRLAIDIEGEDEELRAMLRPLEQLRRQLARLRTARRTLERAAEKSHRGLWRCQSRRLRVLVAAADRLHLAEQLVTSALCSSGTMTDENPL